ncbi:hypothetical protein NMG60_11033709 [Bertholletia excelsa]
MSSRRPKWLSTPPPPSPKILNLPRRTRRKPHKSAAAKPPVNAEDYEGRLEALFHQERAFSRTIPVPVVLLNSGGDGEKRERIVEGREDGDGDGDGPSGFVEEKWRFQAEILRAECNFLRMEREFALKKLERNRLQMERTLRSAVQTLVSGRKKMYEGKNANAVLEEEIEDLEDKLEELQKSSGGKDFEVQHCSNFDKKASFLQRRLEKLGGLSDEKCIKEIKEMAEASFPSQKNSKTHNKGSVSPHKSHNKFTHVEALGRKMEGLSKGMLARMKEECESMPSTTVNNSVTSSASASGQIEFPDSFFFTRQPYQDPTLHDENKCSGRCKAVVERILEQVRAETEQWSQMQEMLGQVREEMEELQASRDFWEDRALDSDYEIQALHVTVKEWRRKALAFENKAKELQSETSSLKVELEKVKREQNEELMKTKEVAQISLGAHIAKEKLALIHRLKENRHHNCEKGSKQDNTCADGRRKAHTSSNELKALKRSPLKNIENSSPKLRQSSKAVFPLHFPEPSNAQKSF